MFEMRSYYKSDLACLYSPNTTVANARKTLWRWMHRHPLLMPELEAMHYNPCRKTFLRQEVEVIVKYLGEP